MKKTTRITSLLFLTFMMFGIAVHAQNYLPIPLSGFTDDVIANGEGPALGSITNDVDGVNYALVSKDYKLNATSSSPTYGLPIDGKIITTSKSFQLADYSSNNSLRLEGANQTGTLTFDTPKKALDIYVLGVSGSGSSTVSAEVTFADNTTESFTGISYPDWYSNIGNIVVSQVGRINTTNNGFENGPQLFEGIINISAANQDKEISSITFTTTSGSGSHVMNVLAISINPVLDDCTGTPDAGMVNNLAVCDGVSFTLTTTNPSEPANGLERQWQESPAGQNIWTDILGADQNSYIVSAGTSSPMDYRFIITCDLTNNSDTSDVIEVTLSPTNECYCTPEGTNSTRYINNFTTTGGIQNITNSGTGFSPGGYGDFTSMVVEQNALGSISFNANISGGSAGFRIWVDWNQDGIFDPATEVVYSSTNYADLHIGSFDVPVTALGGTTRMRIVSHWLSTTGDISSCATAFSYGEFEDYTFEVIAATDCSGTPTAGTISGPTQICATVPFNVEMDNPLLESGITYQWQTSPAGADTWTDIVGETAANYSATSGITTETDYRLIVTCNNSNQSDTSNIHGIILSPSIECYCEPIYTGGEYTSAFSTTGAIENVSFSASTVYNYQDLSATDTIKVEPGTSIDFSHTYSSGGNTIIMWVDWNQDGIFDPVTEMIHNSYNGSATQTGSIDIPITASAGNYRFRLRSRWSTTSTMSPCSSESWGSALDYTLHVTALDDCTGTPDAGVVSNINVCSDQSFTLSTDNPSDPANGLVRQWQQSPAGQNVWTDIVGADLNTHTVVGGISVPMDYRFIITCTFTNNADTSDVIEATLNPANECYCIPEGTNASRYINNFSTTGGIQNITNNGSGFSPGGYGDFTAMVVEQEALESINFSVNITGGTAGFRIWVDWNQDGIFDPVTEVVYHSTGFSSTHTGSFEVPVTALGGTTRMRIVSNWSWNDAPNSPCETGFALGEFEDYTFEVIPADDCSGTPTVGIITGPTEICATVPFTLEMDNPILEAGITYQWQSSPAGANTWADIAGADNFNHTMSNGITDATDFRLIVTCTNSNQSDTSNVLSVTMEPGSSCYCEPSYTFGCGSDNIRDVILAGEVAPGINNLNTPCPPTGYQDYSATMSATLLAGNTYSGNVTTDYSAASENVRIWIDYNQNGIFEANETVATLANLSNSSTGAFSFTVPPTTAAGTYKMRVRLVWSTSPLNIDPCSNESYGETHDYTILIDGLCTDPIVDLGPDVTICEGESITLDAGNPGLDFEWNDNSTGQTLEVSTSGTYYVTVSEDDCSTTDTVVVTVQDLPTVNLGGDVTICEGESITLDAGNPGADFEWSDNSTGQTLEVTDAGTYTVTVMEGTCSASDTVEVSYFDAPSADGIIANNQDECFFTFSVDNAQNATHFEWDFGDGSPATIGANVNHTYTANGAFIVTLTMVNDCEDTLTLTHEVACSGIGINEVIADKNAVTLYPNPTTDQVTIESAKHLTMEQVTVYNVLGQNVYQDKPMSRSKHAIDVSKMASGVYTIHVQTNDGVIIRKFEIIK